MQSAGHGRIKALYAGLRGERHPGFQNVSFCVGRHRTRALYALKEVPKAAP